MGLPPRNDHLEPSLRDAINAANENQTAAHEALPMDKFEPRRLGSAEKSLHKRMRLASRAKKSDYASYHAVRKAGEKVRYLLEFFEPLRSKKQFKSAKALKKIQKRFGVLNDAVASEELLLQNTHLLQDDISAGNALAALEKERRRRMRAAARLL